MKNALTIVARIEAKPDHIDAVKAGLKKLIQPTLAEAGCLQYDLHQDNENAAVFLFFENWESRELWQDHMNSAHLKAFQEGAGKSVDSLIINEMSQIE